MLKCFFPYIFIWLCHFLGLQQSKNNLQENREKQFSHYLLDELAIVPEEKLYFLLNIKPLKVTNFEKYPELCLNLDTSNPVHTTFTQKLFDTTQVLSDIYKKTIETYQQKINEYGIELNQLDDWGKKIKKLLLYDKSITTFFTHEQRNNNKEIPSKELDIILGSITNNEVSEQLKKIMLNLRDRLINNKAIIKDYEPCKKYLESQKNFYHNIHHIITGYRDNPSVYETLNKDLKRVESFKRWEKIYSAFEIITANKEIRLIGQALYKSAVLNVRNHAIGNK